MSKRGQDGVEFTVGKTMLSGTPVLSPSSSLTFENCKEMREAMELACEQNPSSVVLDCRAVAFMDSEALELLVDIHEKLNANRGQLRLVHLNEVCSDILTVSRLIHVLGVYGDLNQAVRGE